MHSIKNQIKLYHLCQCIPACVIEGVHVEGMEVHQIIFEMVSHQILLLCMPMVL